MTTKQPIAVLGGGSFGTAIANLLAENGHDVLLWMRDEQQAESIRTLRQNPRYLKGIDLLGWLGWYGPAKLPEPIVQRLNAEINAPEVRLVGKEGEALGIVPIYQALKMAEEAEVAFRTEQAGVLLERLAVGHVV